MNVLLSGLFGNLSPTDALEVISQGRQITVHFSKRTQETVSLICNNFAKFDSRVQESLSMLMQFLWSKLMEKDDIQNDLLIFKDLLSFLLKHKISDIGSSILSLCQKYVALTDHDFNSTRVLESILISFIDGHADCVLVENVLTCFFTNQSFKLKNVLLEDDSERTRSITGLIKQSFIVAEIYSIKSFGMLSFESVQQIISFLENQSSIAETDLISTIICMFEFNLKHVELEFSLISEINCLLNASNLLISSECAFTMISSAFQLIEEFTPADEWQKACNLILDQLICFSSPIWNFYDDYQRKLCQSGATAIVGLLKKASLSETALLEFITVIPNKKWDLTQFEEEEDGEEITKNNIENIHQDLNILEIIQQIAECFGAQYDSIDNFFVNLFFESYSSFTELSQKVSSVEIVVKFAAFSHSSATEIILNNFLQKFTREDERIELAASFFKNIQTLSSFYRSDSSKAALASQFLIKIFLQKFSFYMQKNKMLLESLIECICCICSENSSWISKITDLFMDLWFKIIVNTDSLGFCEKSINLLKLYSPSLLNRTEVDCDFVYSTENVTFSVRDRLSRIIGVDCSKLTSFQVLYFLTIFTIESGKIESGVVGHIEHYLCDPQIYKNGLFSIMESIASICIRKTSRLLSVPLANNLIKSLYIKYPWTVVCIFKLLNELVSNFDDLVINESFIQQCLLLKIDFGQNYDVVFVEEAAYVENISKEASKLISRIFSLVERRAPHFAAFNLIKVLEPQSFPLTEEMSQIRDIYCKFLRFSASADVSSDISMIMYQMLSSDYKYLQFLKSWSKSLNAYSSSSKSIDPIFTKMTSTPSAKIECSVQNLENQLKSLKLIEEIKELLQTQDSLLALFMFLDSTEILPNDSISVLCYLLNTQLEIILTLLQYGSKNISSVFEKMTMKVLNRAFKFFETQGNMICENQSSKIFNNVSRPILLKVVQNMAKLKSNCSPLEQAKKEQLLDSLSLAEVLLLSKIEYLEVWHNGSSAQSFNKSSKSLISVAWSFSPRLAFKLLSLTQNANSSQLKALVLNNTELCLSLPEAADFVIESGLKNCLAHLIYWSPVAPIKAISLMGKKYQNSPLVSNYAFRSLLTFPPELVFFYIPQIVQTLRHDSLGFVDRFILEVARISRVFCHQIIWNMKANMFVDENSEVPDTIKPHLDHIIIQILQSLSKEDKEFFEREFSFFFKVTSISGILKPFIKKSKLEKKKKIDEELKKITVDPGVYLPSNPESIVVDIDYNSGRPLQSHAKAPFLATFKIKNPKSNCHEDYIWQSAIFKVGDDCRQDVLALQIISVCKAIFESFGLSMYLYPYRVVATAPGCGVIEVIPNSISRDQMGREKLNSLFEYFTFKFKFEYDNEFKAARSCFIKSMAAYSIISYILAIKDRHNGNIMVDELGHIIHIDFGFILDISPGGMGFENAPFKLTTEMIQVMGGRDSANYRYFESLCIKGYLAIRPYCDSIVSMVELMCDSGLPCFKGESTIRKLRERFRQDLSDKDAALYMKSLVDKSCENLRTVFYDSFQKKTNGIPY